MKFIKSILLLYILSVIMMPVKITASDRLTDKQKEAAKKMFVLYETDYAHVCDGCDFIFKYDRLEYWKAGKLYWSDVTWGGGSGNLSKVSMGASPATSSGDRLVVPDGTYGTITASNLSNITIIAQTNRVNETGLMTLTNNNGVTVSKFTFIGQSTAIQYLGHNESGGLNHVSFSGVTTDCINSDVTRTTYNGTTASLSLYAMTFDSVTVDQSAYVTRLNFGSPGSGQGFSRNLSYTRVKITQTLSNGEEIRGICYGMTARDFLVTYVGTPPSSGDVGIYTLYGWGSFSNMTQKGCKGYVVRIYQSELIGVAASVYFFNNFKGDGVSFGCFSPRVDPADFGTYVEGVANTYVWNNGILHSHDAGYKSPFMVLGAHLGDTIHIHNNYAIDITTDGSPILQNDAGTGALLDTSNNSQFASNLYVDETTHMPLVVSYMRNGGVTKSWMTADAGVDANGHAWEGTRPIGPLAYFISVGCGAPDCSPGRLKSNHKN